ncbi:uncharacterized protein LOC134288384 [Aedes albopictus]|uniref:Peptidase A2 domain-containing protein n=1 Tax=Aedes albopictus TaxID=7160 RepID=A0ABM1Z874_AEDAL
MWRSLHSRPLRLYHQILYQNRQMAEQNTQMMQIMERFGIQENVSHRPTDSPEFIIESLASYIREFVYDPENGFVFGRWHRNHLRDYTFEDTVKKLKELFGRRISLFSKRYLCFQLTKNDADDFLTYAGTVNRTPSSGRRLLTKLEGNAEGECTLKSLITECQRLQNRKHDTALVEQKKSCGGVNYVRDCSYMKHVCRDCKQTGHKEGYYSCYSSKAAGKKKTNVNGVFSINQKDGSSNRKFLTVDIDGSKATLQLDTASDMTVISKKHSINLFGLDWIELFGLWDTPLSTICNQVHVPAPTDQIQRYKAASFPDVFKPDLGHC